MDRSSGRQLFSLTCGENDAVNDNCMLGVDMQKRMRDILKGPDVLKEALKQADGRDVETNSLYHFFSRAMALNPFMEIEFEKDMSDAFRLMCVWYHVANLAVLPNFVEPPTDEKGWANLYNFFKHLKSDRRASEHFKMRVFHKGEDTASYVYFVVGPRSTMRALFGMGASIDGLDEHDDISKEELGKLASIRSDDYAEFVRMLLVVDMAESLV